MGLAPFGIVGFETALAVSISYLVRPGHLEIADVVRLLTQGPAEVIRSGNRPAGVGDLFDGCRADITVFDPGLEWVVEPARLHSKSKNTPYGGYHLTGRAQYVMAGGELLVSKGNVRGSK